MWTNLSLGVFRGAPLERSTVGIPWVLRKLARPTNARASDDVNENDALVLPRIGRRHRRTNSTNNPASTAPSSANVAANAKPSTSTA
jgi:hypothetical protein